MAGKSIRFHPEAEQEYLASLAWYGERSVIAARDFESGVTTAIETIRAAPQRWPNYFGGFQRYMLHQFPFSIVYQELLSEIFVVAVAHGHRRPGYWRKRAEG